MSKAKRYSKNSDNRMSFSIKGILLFLLPAPILLTSFLALLSGDVKGIITNSIAFALFLLAAYVARKGFEIEKVYNNSPIAKAPKLPYKFTSAIILSIATFFASYFATENSMMLSAILAGAAFLGFILYYGFDPREDKLGDLRVGISAEEVIDITSRAKKSIQKLTQYSEKVKSDGVREKIQSIIKETKDVIKSVEESPNDLSRARKFFNVYLHRSEKITQEYIENLKNGNIDEKMQNNYIQLLDTVITTIHQQKEKLNQDDITRLDVQIEALTKQIKHEGV
jgi:5-bromo-4-chloroindolyl phosphate hydrolysis protein